MAAHIGQPTRSRRFIKVYLLTWGLLAVGAVAYLALLAVPQQASAPPPPEAAAVEPAKDKDPPAAAKALAEVRSMRGSLSEIRKDVSQLQEAVGERVVNEKVVQSRLTALEERVATIEPDQPPAPAAPAPSVKAPDKTAGKASETRTTADILAKTKEEPATPAKADAPAQPPFVPIETGSIASAPPKTAPKAEIVFGEAVVTPAERADFAVQLAAGPSLQMLRQSWDKLVARHGNSLASLKPRVVSPRSEGGIYRLVAGPMPTKAEADKVCAALAVGPKACFATEYAGQPL